MDPVQVYETTIFNRDRAGEGFHFVSVPARSFAGGEVPAPPALARALGLRDTVERFRVPDGGRAEPWMLPFIIDAALGHDPDFPYWFEYEPPFRRGRRAPSQFAQYLAFEPLIPFESSLQRSRSLSELATMAATATGVAAPGAALGYAVADGPILLLTVPAGMVFGASVLGAAFVSFQWTVERLQRLLDLANDSGENSTDSPGEDG